MTHHVRARRGFPTWGLQLLAAALAVTIFVIDTVTPLEIAVAVFYVAVILLSMRFLDRQGVMLVSAGCILLTLTSYALTKTGATESGLINCAISISAILLTTYLVLKMVSVEVAAAESRAQLLRVARVMTLGELTASIAHEVNQPLTAVVSSGDACLRWLGAEPPNVARAQGAVERMIHNATRASDIVARVRGLAKGAPGERDWVSINDIIRDVLTLVRTEFARHDVMLTTRLADDLPEVLIDAIQVQQVVLNLVVNAVEALASVQGRPRQLLVTTALSDRKRVVVTVKDSGIGIAKEQVGQVFEAFHTSKRGGMGIGLAVSRSIVEAHGGSISAAPVPGGGAEFTFVLSAEGARP